MHLLPLILAPLLAQSPTCPRRGAAIIVETGSHQMTLCDGGAAVRVYRVALGSGGVASKRVGWAQTPVGAFSLSTPRPSTQFHLFVPLVNPDPKRFSAWAIGVHGPPRATKDLGVANVEVDWTLGCVALSSDAEIDEVAAWARTTGARRIELRR
jgi:L,D-peptidoglycan transpeptidase YkuD (ErfK/YbiS/YcfS/YnhG family)